MLGMNKQRKTENGESVSIVKAQATICLFRNSGFNYLFSK